MAIHDMSADKQGGSMALDFYIIPNLYSLKLDRDISANNVSADSDGYSPDILKATTSDFLKEKERQCKALGKDTCTFADIYQAKARSAGTGKINAFLSAFSITANGFNLSNDGTHRTVSINGREYLTFVGLYEMLREKAAKPFSLERSIVGANFASSSNVMALVTTDDGTPDGTLSRDVYPLGAFQK